MLKTVLILLIQGLRPLLGPGHCKYTFSCTPYALKQLEEKNILSALYAIIKRLLSCNPFF